VYFGGGAHLDLCRHCNLFAKRILSHNGINNSKGDKTVAYFRGIYGLTAAKHGEQTILR